MTEEDPPPRAPEPGASPLQFPTDFPIKVMGHNELEFEPQIVALVRLHAPDLDLATVEVRQSRTGKYLSLTLTVRARSRDQLDAIYLALTAHPLVKVAL
jgi:putative lipoic acid-binding regulatory protein